MPDGTEVAVEAPDFSGVRSHEMLLARAARYWRISDSALPPTLDEILMRDMVWDDEVFAMRTAQDYFVDLPKLTASGLL